MSDDGHDGGRPPRGLRMVAADTLIGPLITTEHLIGCGPAVMSFKIPLCHKEAIRVV